MGRMSFSEELRSLSERGGAVNAGECWTEVTRLHRELGRVEHALGRAAWTLRYGERGEWRGVLRDAAAETLGEARRAASRYDADRLRSGAGWYARLARCPFADAAAVMLKPGERAAGNGGGRRRLEHVGHAAPEIRWRTEEGPEGQGRRRGRGRAGRGRDPRRTGMAAT
jgi:hypothetical protein